MRKDKNKFKNQPVEPEKIEAATEEVKAPKYVSVEPMREAIAHAIKTGQATVDEMRSKRQVMYLSRVRRAMQLFEQSKKGLTF